MKQVCQQFRTISIILFCLGFSLIAKSQKEEFTIEKAFKENKIKRGIYLSFDDFIKNEPSLKDSFYLELKYRTSKGWEGTTQVIPRLVEKDRKIKKVWGFSDGIDLYIFHQVEFYPLSYTSGEFQFRGYQLMDASEGAVVGGVLGGAIGAVIGGAIDNSATKGTSVVYDIDRLTGNAIHPDDKAALELSRKNHFIIYRRSKKESQDEIVFTISDSLTYSVEPDSYVNLAFTPEVPVKICLGKDDTDCLIVEFNENEEVSFIKLSLLEGGNQPSVEQMSESKGVFEYYKLEKKQDKRGIQEPISKP